MPKEETIELRHIRGVIGEKEDLPFGNSRSTAISKLKTLLSRTTGLPYNMHLTGIGGYDRTLSVGATQINSFASDGEYLYACIYQLPGQIVKISLKTFTVEATLTFSDPAPFGSALTNIVITGGGDGENYLYTVAFDDPCLVYKVLLSNFTIIAALTLTTTAGYCLATDSEYLYVGHGRYITRINIETFTETSILDTGEFAGISARSLLCLGSYLYAASNSAPARLVKIDTDTFTITSTLGFAENSAISLTTDGNYIYIGLDTNIIKKIDVLSFTEIGSIGLAAGIYALICDSTNLYCALNTSPGQIAIIDLSTFQFIDTITTSGNQIRSLYYDDSLLYYGFYASDGVERTYLIPESSADSKRIAAMNLDIVTIETLVDDLETRLTAARAGYLDELGAANIPADIDTVLEQVHTGTYYIYPQNAAPVSITSGAGAYTKGNYVEVIPAGTITTTFYIVGLYINEQTALVDYEIDIATGGAGAEVVIATDSAIYSSANRSFDMIFPIPIKVAANTRVAVRCSDAVGSKIVLVKIRCKD